MDTYADVYQRARSQLEGEPERLLEELDRVLSAPQRDPGPRLEETVRLAEMALVARLDPWWAGPPQPNIRNAVARLSRALGDPLALGLGLRLAAGYARLGRIDDEAHRLARLAASLQGTGLPHPDGAYAEEAARHLEKALFLPSAHYTYDLVKDRPPEEVALLVSGQLARGNTSFAALLAEMRLVRALDDWYLGPPLPNVETALVRYGEGRPPELHDLAILLARAYLKGGFVDLRARDHIRALLEGEEAKLLGPEEAIGLQEFVDRDCFDYPYAHSYRLAKTISHDELRAAVRRHTANGAISCAQRLCEMALVRRFDDWYLGDPTRNVRGALTRYLESSLGQDPDADWCARYLAGLYAATLEGSSHARLLVHATVAVDAESPVFGEAIRAAGIPADVPVEELHELYRGVVEIDAKVEAFRTMAEEGAGRDLSEYERKAYGEVLRFLEQGERSVWSEVGQTLGEMVEVVVPDSLLRSVTAVVEDVLRMAIGGASATLGRERILSELARHDPALRSLDKIGEASLELLDEVAWAITRENRVAAALEGLGCGLGGATLVLIDLPMLILVNLNAVAAVATSYGFDIDDPRERDFAIGILAGGATALRQVVGGSPEPVEEPLAEVAPEHLASNRAALALHTAATRIAARLTRHKLAQLLPILGGAVGAGLNFHFTHTTSRTAVMAYRYRWLMRRFLEG